MLKYKPHLKAFSRELRTHQTDAEAKLWYHLRRKQLGGIQFYRQRPIGPYIVDFYAPSILLAVEVDGSQHLESTAEKADAERTAFLQRQQIDVLRFDNLQVLMQTEAVIETIHTRCTSQNQAHP